MRPSPSRRPGQTLARHWARTGLASSAVLTLVASTALVLAGPATATPSLAPLLGPRSVQSAGGAATASVVKDSFIVVLKDPAALKATGVHAASASTQATAAAGRARAAGSSIGHIYTDVLQGYSATLSASQLTAVRQDPAVAYVQRDQLVRGAGTAGGPARAHPAAAAASVTQKNLDTWGLDRIDQRSLPLNGAYYYNRAGQGVTAYVVEGGVYSDQPDLAGRVRGGVDEVGSTDGTAHCNPVATHAAGVLGGTEYGVAKGVSIVSVRVLGCDGSGTTAHVLAGLDWIAADPVTGPRVVDLSLTDSDGNPALDASVQGLIDAGITVVAMAGDGDGPNGRGVKACTASPGDLPAVITAAASTSGDRAASYTNYGDCVDLYAPGDQITSNVPGPADGSWWVNTYDGSFAAAAHAAGAAALYLGAHPGASPATVSAWLAASSTKNKITGVNTQFPHDLLFSLEPVALPPPTTTGDHLRAGQSLVRPDRLYSANGEYFLAHRSRDGWLCLYQTATGKVIWTNGHSGAWTNMNIRSYLGSYDAYGRRTWVLDPTPNLEDGSTLKVNGKGYLQLSRDFDDKVTWASPH